MLTRLKSTISTVTSTLQAVRELLEVLVSRLEKQAAEIESLHSYAAQLIGERDALGVEVKLLNGTLRDWQTEHGEELGAHKETKQNLESAVAKLARYEAAETWRQVTAGEGELPPRGISVIYRTANDLMRIGEPRFDRMGPFEWRHLSSGDVPQ